MKKNIKKAFIIIFVGVIICTLLTACGSNASEGVDDITSNQTLGETIDDPISVDMESLVNASAEGKPIVKISCGAVELSYDISEIETSKVEVTIHEAFKEDYFYVTMAGNVTAHTLVSDGSLFDGLAMIENCKAQFSVTYDEREVEFIINVPNA